MANIVGSIMFCYGAWLLYAGFRHRNKCLSFPAGEDEESPLAALGEIMPPMILLGLGIAALEVTLAYVMIAPNALFSLFDLIGVLFALGAYGTWIILKTRFRHSSKAG